MKQSLETALQHAVDQLLKENGVEAHVRVQLTRPKQKEHGDYAANVAMSLAGQLNRAPRAVAEMILSLPIMPFVFFLWHIGQSKIKLSYVCSLTTAYSSTWS